MDAYGVGWSPSDVAGMAMWYLNHAEKYGITHELNATEIKTLVCRRFTITTLHYTKKETAWAKEARCPVQWLPPGSKPGDCDAQGSKDMGVHTKFWLVDDVSFYVGSQNLYPANLAEW